MIAAAHQPPKCDFIGRLLLTGIEYTDARPWIGLVGAASTVLIGALAISRWLS